MIKHYRTLLLVFALFCNTVVIQAQNVSLKLNNVTVKDRSSEKANRQIILLQCE